MLTNIRDYIRSTYAGDLFVFCVVIAGYIAAAYIESIH